MKELIEYMEGLQNSPFKRESDLRWVMEHAYDPEKPETNSFSYVECIDSAIYWGYSETEDGYDEGNCESSRYESFIDFVRDFE